MSKQFWAVILAVAVVLGGIFWFTGNHNKADTSNSSKNSGPTEHIEGKGSTGVTLVEYGDFECPYCGEYFPIVEQVVSQYKDKIYFQFRNFPLVSIHKNAFAAARAAEAAGLQDKFWEMYAKLYQNQDPNGASGWVASSDPLSFFDQYAKQIGLDVQKFDSDFSSSRVNDAVNADEAAGNKLGITGTPTFYLDGKQIQPAISVDSFQKILNAEIAKKTADGKPASTAPSTSTTKQ